MAITINGTANTVAGLAVGGLPDGSTDADALASNAVTNAKVADDAIGVAELSATGTAGATTFLRGDNAWAVPADTGAVIQVKNHKHTTNVEHTTTSETDTGSTIDITPTSSSNKILVIVSGNTRTDKTGGGDTLGVYKIYRDSTMIAEWYHGTYEESTSNRMVLTLGGTGLTILDAPASTSSITYKVTMKCIYGTHIFWSSNTLPSTITVMEVKP